MASDVTGDSFNLFMLSFAYFFLYRHSLKNIKMIQNASQMAEIDVI